MLLKFPRALIQNVVNQYLPFSKKIYFAFSGNNYLNSSLEDGRIAPDKKFKLELIDNFYCVEIDTTNLAVGWHKGKPVVPTQKPWSDGRVAVSWIDCPANPPEPFRQEQKRKNWEFPIGQF